MGVAFTGVLIASNIAISAMRNIIPDNVRIPVYVVIIASFVTMTDQLMHAFTPALYTALGIFIPLIVVNCIILGRAEAFANKNPIIPSIFDALGMGVGFTLALVAGQHLQGGARSRDVLRNSRSCRKVCRPS